jgi:protein tyrosine phosphatase (PTP) superfamily phosphohydrolase (DUF442 family)
MKWLRGRARLPIAGEVCPGVVSAGQPRAEQWSEVREAGFGTVVDMRDRREPRDHDEAAAVRAAGMRYEHLPVGHGPVPDAVFERLQGLVRERGDEGLFVHCASGNRSAGALIPALMLEEGATEQEALEAAVEGGLRSRELAAMAFDYVGRTSRKAEAA